MDHNIRVLLWSMIGDDESDFYFLERNVLQFENNIWNLIVVDE